MPITKREKLAYIAGLLDGEGCIMIVKLKGKSWNKRTDYALTIRISNTNKDVLDWISVNYCGKVFQNAKSKYWHKESFNWQVGDRTAEKVLNDLLPYLIVKKERAKVALQFRETKKNNHTDYYRVPISVSNKRESLCLKMRELNRKGALLFQ